MNIITMTTQELELQSNPPDKMKDLFQTHCKNFQCLNKDHIISNYKTHTQRAW